MKHLGRRTLLKFMGAAPAALPALGPSAAMQLSGVGVAAAPALTGQTGVGPASVSSSQPLRFLSFASWLKEIGHDRLRNEAREVRFIDPDLATMRLPLTTLVRWQQERNYQALLAQRETWFQKTVQREGKVEWWP